jgi:hypothetical protein
MWYVPLYVNCTKFFTNSVPKKILLKRSDKIRIIKISDNDYGDNNIKQTIQNCEVCYNSHLEYRGELKGHYILKCYKCSIVSVYSKSFWQLSKNNRQ